MVLTVGVLGDDNTASAVKTWGATMLDRVRAAATEASQLALTMAKEATPIRDQGFAHAQVSVEQSGAPNFHLTTLHGGASYSEHIESSTEEQEGSQPLKQGATAGHDHLNSELGKIASETGAKTTTKEQSLAQPDSEGTGWLIGAGGTEGSDVAGGDTQNFGGSSMTEQASMETGLAEGAEGGMGADLGEGFLSMLEDIAMVVL